jgi:SAM-dependent methyltransferase
MSTRADDARDDANRAARTTWTRRPVGSQRSAHAPGDPEYFEDLRRYRYGYETPFIPDFFRFDALRGQRVLEVGVGNGVDAVAMMQAGALYHGVDVTARHLELTAANLQQHGLQPGALWCADLLQLDLPTRFDAIYSFGVLHHIPHEAAYLARMRELLAPGGRVLIGVYSKYSFFNTYLVASWLARCRARVPLDHWRSHVAELSELHEPVTIRIRSRAQVQRLLEASGLRVERYRKAGFVQGNLPLIGRLFAPDGGVLNACGALLGWYHLFECSAALARSPAEKR